MNAPLYRRPTGDQRNFSGDYDAMITNYIGPLTALITLYRELAIRSELLGRPEDMNNTIRYQQLALKMVPEVEPIGLRSMLCMELGQSCMLRFEHLGEISDLDKAIDYRRQAVVLTPDIRIRKLDLLDRLGGSYLCRFKHLGKLADIDKAIHYKRQAVLLTREGHEDKPGRLNNIGVSYRCRFDRLGELSDMDEAIKCQSQALLLIRNNHKNRPILLTNLGNSYMRRFDIFGELEDLDKSIGYLSQAVLLIPASHTDRPGLLNNLGNAHRARYQRYGDLADIDKAIHCQNRAVLLTLDSHPSKAGRLSNLGGSYTLRYERYREVLDIDNAVDCHLQAVRLTPDSHPDKPLWLHNLGHSCLSRFELHREPAALANAINAYDAAVCLIPDDHADKSMLLASLGNLYLARFPSSGMHTDIESAIKYFDQALLLTPDTHARRSHLLRHLGNSFLTRFYHLGEFADIEKSIEYMNQALLLTPDNHSGMPSLLHSLANTYRVRFGHSGELSDVETAHTLYQQAAQTGKTNLPWRIVSARRWAQCSTLLGASPRVAYHRIMELVPQLSWLGTALDQRMNFMATTGDAVMEAAAWAISVQAYDLAAEWLEVGRFVVWGQLLQLRKPLDDLSAADPALSERLKHVALELQRVGSRSIVLTTPTLELEQVTQYHHSLASEWDQLIERARLLPGFEGFMRPHKSNQLIRAAKEGPVAIVNVHSSRCDALIALPNGSSMAHVPLHNFSPEKAVRAREQLLSLIGDRGARAGGFKRAGKFNPKPEEFKEILATLWWDVVKPVLDFLGFTRRLPVEELPRVTWCTTQELSFLPLHAAGCYNGSQPNAFDLVISSYVPTLSALLATDPPVSNRCSGILAVGQMSTEGFGSLPNTVKELAAIRTHAKSVRYLQLDGEKATVKRVLKGMKEHSWVHLACHATQHKVYPTESAFHLHDGGLDLLAVAEQSFKNKGLAFLSACQTATGDRTLPDEAVHLAAGMLMVGYPSVIATMWGIADVDAPEVAHHVYAELLKDRKMDYTGAARALHKAAAALREKIGQDSFERWVPFVHIGH